MAIVITKGQKNILLITAIAVVLIAGFRLFVYRPTKNTVRKLKTELAAVQYKINAIEAVVGQNKSLEEGVVLLQERLNELDKKFPDNERETLRMISKLAYKHGLNVTSIKPQSKSLFTDKNNSPVTVEDKVYETMSISMVAHAPYVKLGKFLEAIRRDIAHLLSVKRLTLAKKAKQYELNADIELVLYLLTEKTQ
jgi:Tfp pilus assembly protein PilO